MSSAQSCTLFALTLFGTSAAQLQASKPNILFIVIDDLGFTDVGFRSHDINTPVIDSLARTGIVLNQYYVQDVCSPSRATFQTGRYAMHHSVVDWIPPGSAYGLPLNETTMAQKMQEGGYRTHASGKWHLGFYKWEMTPTFRGFESFVGFYSGGEDYFTHQAGGGAYDFRRDPTPFCGENCSQVAWVDNHVYSTTVFTTEAVRVINAFDFSGKPLFYYLAYQGVHSPAQVPDSYIEPYNTSISDPVRRTFAGMLSCVDEGIGNVTAALKAAGAFENTLFVFTADNGGPTTTGDGVGARNWPLRGGKHSIWEGGVRATGFIAGSETLLGVATQDFREYQGLMHGADWLPTLSSVAGYDLNGTQPLDGVNQWLALTSLNPVGPRTHIVLGNSTNMCSWPKNDPRYHGRATIARDGADLPNGATENGDTLGCGFSIRENAEDRHWKLIFGYGGGPDQWCNKTKGGPSCGTPNQTTVTLDTTNATCQVVQGLCYHGNDLNHVVVAKGNLSACCDLCMHEKDCRGWTYNEGESECWLKSTMKGGDVTGQCTSGNDGTTPLPPPSPPSPSPSGTECPNGWCLFDTASDPYEEKEISAGFPDIVSSMQAEMATVLKTYTEYVIDKNCPPQKFQNTTQGRAWAPWC
eukprot:m.25803 g.25803  ORF g.25803 m.25803 type:complete len:638 (-) comp15175_c0_seq1:193-2106(-)